MVIIRSAYEAYKSIFKSRSKTVATSTYTCPTPRGLVRLSSTPPQTFHICQIERYRFASIASRGCTNSSDFGLSISLYNGQVTIALCSSPLIVAFDALQSWPTMESCGNMVELVQSLLLPPFRPPFLPHHTTPGQDTTCCASFRSQPSKYYLPLRGSSGFHGFILTSGS